MTDLPAGWALLDAAEGHGPHVLTRDGARVAAIRFREATRMGDAALGDWEWHGLSGAREMAPWTAAGFEDFDAAVADAVATLSEVRLWTIADVTTFLGMASTGSARKTLSRWGVQAVARQPGRAGASLYDPEQVRAARKAAPGQGARTDRRTT